MMRAVFLAVASLASLPVLCNAGGGMVRSKSSRVPPKGLASQEDLSTGYDGAQDLPTVKATKVTTAISSSAVVKAGASGPTFGGDDSTEEHPNVVDTIPHNYDTSLVGADDSGSSLPMLLFLVCGGGCVAWLYTTPEKRNEAKDKADSVMRLLGPMVQEAMGAIGEVVKTAGHAQNALNGASVHLRAAGLQSSYQKVGSHDDDELIKDEPKEEDPYANAAAGMESMFQDMDDEDQDVPTLVEQAPPPLDLFTDNMAAPLLDFAGSEPMTLDSLGLVDTENKVDLGLDF